MKPRVLIVDDNRELAENLAEILGDEGCRCRTAASGEAALAAADAEPFDVVLTDIRMPGIGGVELVAELSRRCPGAIYLLMTAYTSDQTLRAAEQLGVVRAVFAKPLAIEKLLGLLSERGAGRVLIVDGDAALAAGLSADLGGHGYDVRVAGTVAGARAAVAAAAPDIAVIDISLPDGSGIALARELCGSLPDDGRGTPVVVMTGLGPQLADPAVRRLAPRVVQFLTKPFPAESLRTALEGVVEEEG